MEMKVIILFRCRSQTQLAKIWSKSSIIAISKLCSENNKKSCFCFLRLQNDRVRQEQLAKERLQRLRDRKRLSKSEKILDLDSKIPNMQLMEMVEKRHIMEQEVIVRNS